MIRLDNIYDRLAPHQRPTMLADSLEIAFEAEGNGWTERTLTDALRSVMSPSGNAGATVYHLRKLAGTPAPRGNGHGKPNHVGVRTHHPCDAGHDGCVLCYCRVCPPSCALNHAHERYPEHHVLVPMPDEIRTAIRDAINSSRIPE